MREEVCEILEGLGLSTSRVSLISHSANTVWRSEAWIIHLSSGALRGALSHQSRVLATLGNALPHARLVAYGNRSGGTGEWMVTSRIPGQPALFAALRENVRPTFLYDFAETLKVFHERSAALGLDTTPPWLADAIQGGSVENLFHPPEHELPRLVDAAGVVLGGSYLLDTIRRFVGARLHTAPRQLPVLVHADLHPGNILTDVSGKISGVVDFEGTRTAEAFIELDTILRWWSYPRDYGSDTPAPGAGPSEIVSALVAVYPELFVGDDVFAGLELQDLAWNLLQIVRGCNTARYASRITDLLLERSHLELVHGRWK